MGVAGSVAVFVGTGMIGEYFLGFGVEVGMDAYTSAGDVCVGKAAG
jgi:hypothetical protein